MMLTGGSPLRLGRVLFVSLALVANLVAAGVPVLHGWAHAPDHGHAVATAAAEVDHPHDEGHPPTLHDECLLTHRPGLDRALALPTAGLELVSLVRPEAPSFCPVAPAPSRAPPSPGQARAPPLA